MQTQLPRDYYVRVAGNDYSVDPSAIGQLIDVTSGLTLTDPVHVETAARLRAQFQQDPPTTDAALAMRDLADYDRAFGVDFDSAPTTLNDEVAL